MDVGHQLHGKGPHISVYAMSNGSFYLLADYHRTREEKEEERKKGNEFITRHESASCTFPAENEYFFFFLRVTQLAIIYWYTQVYTFVCYTRPIECVLFFSDSRWLWSYLPNQIIVLISFKYIILRMLFIYVWIMKSCIHKSIKNEHEWTPHRK